MTGAATEARKRYIQRLNTQHRADSADDKSKPKRSPSAKDARQAMIARIRNERFESAPLSMKVYREDSAENGPMSWYKVLLRNSGYNEKQISIMVGELR